MAAIKLGTQGLTFGCTAETGGIIQSLEVRRSREKAEVKGPEGAVEAVAFFNPTEEISGEFYPTGSSDIAGISPGVAYALAGYVPASGLVIIEEVTANHGNAEFKKMSFKAVVYPAITA